MVDTRNTQPSFTAGELDPALWARKDLARYQVGVRKMLNCFVHAEGGASNRAGLRFAAEVKDHSKEYKLTAFEAADDQAYILVWGDENVRVMAGGAYIDDGGSPYELAVPYAHDEIADLYMEQSNDVATVVHPLYPPAELARYGTTDWRYELVSFASQIDAPQGMVATVTEGYTGYGTDKLKEFHTYKVSTIGATGEESLPSASFVSNTDVVLGYDQNFVTITWNAPGVVIEGSATPNAGVGGAGNTEIDRTTPLRVGETITHVGVFSNEVRTNCKVKIAERTGASTYTINVDQLFDHPGGGWHDVELAAPYLVPAGTHFSGAYMTNWTKQTSVAAHSQSAGDKVGAAQTVTDATGGIVTATRVRYQSTADFVVDSYILYKESNGLYGYIGTTVETTFKDTNFTPAFTNGPQSGRNPFEGAGNYPQTITFVQQRRVFGGTLNNPQTIFETQAGNYKNMGTSSPTQDSDAIEFTLASTKKQDVYHIVPLEKGMIVFTRSGEWRVTGRDGDVITPSSVLPMPQTPYGAAKHVKPLVIGKSILFLQRTGRRVLAMGYSLEADSYLATDLTLLARHLFKGRRVVAWASADDPDGLVWCVLDNGKALCLTYLKEHDVWGWGRAETKGKVTDVAVIPEGNRDVPYFLVERRIGGSVKKYIEYMAPRSFEDIRDAFFVDSGLSLDDPVDIASVSFGATTTITSNGHGLVDDDLIEIDLAAVYDEDDVETRPLDGRWIVAGATPNTFRITHQYDNETLGVETGDDLDTSGLSSSFYDGGGVFRKGFDTVIGLDHLEGRSVVALADGHAIDGLTVVGGAVTPDDRRHFRVHVGLSYRSVIGTLDLVNPQGDDTGITKGVPQIFLRLEKTRGEKVGSTEDGAAEGYSRDAEDYGQPATLKGGLYEVDLWERWDSDQPLYIVQDYPLPMTVLGVTREAVYGGS
jgi:hypothetical protein